jgi:hypothetical protein
MRKPRNRRVVPDLACIRAYVHHIVEALVHPEVPPEVRLEYLVAVVDLTHEEVSLIQDEHEACKIDQVKDSRGYPDSSIIPAQMPSY